MAICQEAVTRGQVIHQVVRLISRAPYPFCVKRWYHPNLWWALLISGIGLNSQHLVHCSLDVQQIYFNTLYLQPNYVWTIARSHDWLGLGWLLRGFLLLVSFIQWSQGITFQWTSVWLPPMCSPLWSSLLPKPPVTFYWMQNSVLFMTGDLKHQMSLHETCFSLSFHETTLS